MENMKTPGVYIVEKNAFPNSVVELATAVPAFVGYTQKATFNGRASRKQAVRITSLKEFEAIFGGSSCAEFDLKISTDRNVCDIKLDNVSYELRRSNPAFMLYQSMQMFYLNGGGACYIVSVGDYSASIQKDELLNGIVSLEKEQEPTLLVIPDAMSLEASACYAVQKQMMLHCGAIMKNRFAILDIHNGYQNKVDSVAAFRNAINDNTEASYSAAYYPWLNTAVLNDDNVNFDNLSTMGKKTLKAIIEKERVAFKGDSSTSAHYDTILKAIQHKLNLLPPSGAMAGLYTLTDNSKGVWQSPANVSIACVISPSVNISAQEQEALNVDLNGKSINALRLFAGEGTLVWGARTLNGNSLDWRYISVRRTVIMLEQSIMLAAKAYVFEPNDANTWITVKSMITNFLTGIWKQGGLAGADPSDAFSVNVGLGETMTGNDILDGRLIISVKVAITRPAEFIEISFTQLMQKS